MGRITYEDNKFMYCDGQRKEELLDVCGYLANKSRLPMHGEPGEASVAQIIIGLQKMNDAIGVKPGDSQVFFLMDILLASWLIGTPHPVSAVEIGSTDGLLSYHMAEMIGQFNTCSSLCCVSNVIGNESGNRWLDMICMVEHPPVLSMLASDYENTRLQGGGFDIAVVNGSVIFDNPGDVIREAERLVRKDGFMICRSKNSLLLEESFAGRFPGCAEYKAGEDEKIMVSVCAGAYGTGEETDRGAMEKELKDLFGELGRAMVSGTPPDSLKIYLTRLDNGAEHAARMNDGRKKDELLCLKERLMDYILNYDGPFASYYKEETLGMLKAP